MFQYYELLIVTEPAYGNFEPWKLQMSISHGCLTDGFVRLHAFTIIYGRHSMCSMFVLSAIFIHIIKKNENVQGYGRWTLTVLEMLNKLIDFDLIGCF